jgi:hypothetical protein
MAFLLLLVIAVAILWLSPRIRGWLLEAIKELSDRLIVFLLRATSGFERELTEQGRAEQRLWREQRLRNLRGLALRSRQRFDRGAS